MTRRILDSHVHVWEQALTPQPWLQEPAHALIDRDFTVAEATTALASTGADSFVLVQTEHSLRETLALIDDARAVEVHGVVGWVDLVGDTVGGLDLIAEQPNGDALVGIRHLAHTETDERWLLQPDAVRGIQAVAHRGLVFDLVLRPWQLPTAVAVARAHPELRIVLDHLGNPPREPDAFELWRHHLAVLARCENVTAKVSGLPAAPPRHASTAPSHASILNVALDAFGPDRLMFGSDWPLVTLTGGYAKWLDAYMQWSGTLSDADQSAIDHQTAMRTYRRAR